TKEKEHKLQSLFPGKPIRHTPNGIDGALWSRSPGDLKKVETWRNRFPQARLVLGFFGHLKRKKGVRFFLECLDEMEEAGATHVHLVGELEPELEANLQAGVGFSWDHRPFLRNPLELTMEYLKADFTVIPSFYDGTPNVLLESAALEIPVIGSNVGGLVDLVEDGTHGFLFRAGCREACQSAIASAHHTSEPQRKEMGAAFHQDILTRCTPDHEADAILELLCHAPARSPELQSNP
ncbi:MAG: glycosyltransferase family 4 protein, partial [Verrucomicrobiota bacterium]